MTEWPGWAALQIAAVVGSFSTPVMWAPSGAVAMNTPGPQPGSMAAPCSKPSFRASRQMASATIGEV